MLREAKSPHSFTTGIMAKSRVCTDFACSGETAGVELRFSGIRDRCHTLYYYIVVLMTLRRFQVEAVPHSACLRTALSGKERLRILRW
jgi:hypothetical protein